MKSKKHASANDLQPFRPVHPGELLKDELEYRHLSQRSVAKQLGLPYTAFNEILNGKRPVTTDFAMIMEVALGTSSSLLLRLQIDYNLQVAKNDSQFSKRLAEIRKIAAVL
jgi:addiction module HigA family antidote